MNILCGTALKAAACNGMRRMRTRCPFGVAIRFRMKAQALFAGKNAGFIAVGGKLAMIAEVSRKYEISAVRCALL